MTTPAARRARADRLDRLRLVAFVLPPLLLAALVALDYVVIERVLPPGQSHLVLLAIGVAGVITFSIVIFSRLTELHARVSGQAARLADLAEALQQRHEQLQALNAAGMALSAELASGAILQKVVDVARAVARARYAALGVFDEDGAVVQFHTSGISDEERARIGELPKGLGILGLLQRERRPLRLRDLRAHPASIGFPPNHPPMRSFLGVPILWRGRSLGNLYLTEKESAAEFSQEDEDTLLTLSAQAAIAIENARLYDQVQRLAVLEERHRIGMDLHDGAIQSLYGLGLLLEDAAARVADEPAAVASELERAVDRLNATIADLRGYVLGLSPAALARKPLHEALANLAERARSNALLEVEVDVRPEAERALDERAAESVFYIAADAFTNIARHARARHATLRLVRDGAAVVLEIIDDGVGFDSSGPRSGHGIANMEERARAVGGRLRLASLRGEGTRVRVELPIGSVAAS